MNFADLKKKSKTNTNLQSLVEQLDKMSNNKYSDDRFWTIPVDDKTGNGTALIRFLPAGKDDALPWVQIYTHVFQGPGGWYIENSLTTIGKQDKIGELNSELWATGIEANKDIARKRKRKLQYIANIMVISDPKNPQNEGKVMLFKFGKKIFEKIQEAMVPVFDGDQALDPFDFWKGADFRLKVKKVDGYPNYDSSSFDVPSALFDGDDKKLEKIWESLYRLGEFTDPSNFKSYEELSNRLDRVLGIKGKQLPSKEIKEQPEASSDNQKKLKEKEPESTNDELPWSSEEEDIDESLSYFRNLDED
jgi:hypothetical protein